MLKNGGISEIIIRSDSEKEVLELLKIIDKKLSDVKLKLRVGQIPNIEDLKF